MTATHADVLTDTERQLWADMRAARGRHQGQRWPAIAELAATRGENPEQLNATLLDIRRRLIDSGVTPAERFFTHPSRNGGWTVAHAPDGSRRCADIAARDGVLEMDSLRFAHNAATALTVIDLLDVIDRETVACQLEQVCDAGTGDHTDREQLELARGAALIVGRYRDTCAFTITGLANVDTVRWTGSVNHARFIAGALRTGAVAHLGGALQRA